MSPEPIGRGTEKQDSSVQGMIDRFPNLSLAENRSRSRNTDIPELEMSRKSRASSKGKDPDDGDELDPSSSSSSSSDSDVPSESEDIQGVFKIGKLPQVNIDKLTQENTRYRIHTMKQTLKFHDAWTAITKYRLIGKHQFQSLVHQKKRWKLMDLKARMIIEQGMKPTDVLNAKKERYAGGVWKYIERRFACKSETEIVQMYMKVIQWKKDPTMTISDSLDQIEQWNNEIEDVAGSNKSFNPTMILIIFLHGLGAEWNDVISSIETSKNYNRNNILLRLRNVEASREMRNAVSGSAGLVKNKEVRCYECNKKGHVAKDCLSRKDRKRNENTKHQKFRKRTNKHRAKTANADVDTDSSISGNEGKRKSKNENWADMAHAVHKTRFLGKDSSQRAQYTSDRWCLDSGATTHIT